MAIGIDRQYLFEFNLGGLKNFIQQDDLIMFKIIEETGNVLPTFDLAFITQDERVIGLLNEGTDLNLSYGRSREDLTNTPLSVMSLKFKSQGQDKRVVRAKGLYSAIEYLNDSKLFISDFKSGVEVIKDKASVFFDTSDEEYFNIETSTDSQRWIQCNQSDKKFLQEVWLHSHVPNSFLACGISMDGRFILKDMKKEAGNFKWRFVPHAPANRNDIRYDSDFGVSSNGGFINSWTGYGNEQFTYNGITGFQSSVTSEIEPILALTDSVPRRNTITKKHKQSLITTGNMHENYWNAYQNNINHLTQFSSIEYQLSFTGIFKDIKVLDLVSVKDFAVTSLSGEAAEYHSGLYYVGKVVRIVQENTFTTVCKLYRESFNSITGDFIAS